MILVDGYTPDDLVAHATALAEKVDVLRQAKDRMSSEKLASVQDELMRNGRAAQQRCKEAADDIRFELDALELEQDRDPNWRSQAVERFTHEAGRIEMANILTNEAIDSLTIINRY